MWKEFRMAYDICYTVYTGDNKGNRKDECGGWENVTRMAQSQQGSERDARGENRE